MGAGQSSDGGVTDRIISVPQITVPKALLKPLPTVDTKDLTTMAKTLPGAVRAAAANEAEIVKYINDVKTEILELQKQLAGLLDLRRHITEAHDMYRTRLAALGALTQAKNKNRLVTSQTAALASRIGTGL